MAAGHGFLTTRPDSVYGDTNGANGTGEALVQKFVMPGSGTYELSEIGLYLKTSGTCIFHLGVFGHDAVNDCPSTIVANSDTGEKSENLVSNTLVSYAYGTKPQVTSGTTYWIGVIPGASNFLWSGFATGGGGLLWRSGLTYPAWPSDAEWESHTDQVWDTSFYALYEAGGGATLIKIVNETLRLVEGSFGKIEHQVRIVNEQLNLNEKLKEKKTSLGSGGGGGGGEVNISLGIGLN